MLDVAQNISRHPGGPFDRDTPRGTSHVVGLRDMVDLVRRRSSFIAWFVAICVGLLSLALVFVESTYTATSMLVLERNETKVLEAVAQLDAKERGQGIDRDRAAVETEMDLITSRVFAGKVVDAMGLVQDPWFNRYLSRRGATAPSETAQRDASITSLLSTIWVTRGGESLVVSVHVKNPDPERAAEIANKIAEIYVEWSRELKLKAMTDAVNFLLERGKQVAQASNLGPQHPDFVKTEAEVASVHAMIVAEIARLEKESEDAKATPPSAEDKADAAARGLAEMRLRELQKNMLADKKIYELVLGRPENRAEIASPSARIVSAAAVPTSASFPQTQRILAAGLVGSFVLAMLFALVLEAIDTRLRDSRRVEQLVQLPNLSEFPAVSLLAAREHSHGLARAVGGLRTRLVRLMRILWRAFCFLTLSAFKSDAGHPRRRGTSPAKPAPANLHLLPRPDSGEIPAARGLYLVCRSRISAAKPAVLLSSPVPYNGNSCVALGFAVAAAQDGLSTVLIDLDPAGESSAALTLRRKRFIEDVTDEICSLAQALQPVPSHPGLYYLASNPLSEEGAAPIKSSSMHALLKELRASFDMIVIESPPVLVHETANWLSPLVDATLLVVQAAKTTEQQLVDASISLKANRSPLIGTVLTGVPRRSDRLVPFVPEVSQQVRKLLPASTSIGRPDAGSSA